MRLVGLLVIFLLLLASAARADTVNFDRGMSGGAKLKAGQVTLSAKKSLYLRFTVPSNWQRANLVIEPRRSSASLRIRPVSGRWRKGLFSRAHSLGPSQVTGALTEPARVAVTDWGVTLTLKLSLRSGRAYLARAPYLEQVGVQTPDNPDQGGSDLPPVQIAAVGDIACSPSDGSFNGGSGTATACAQARVAALTNSSDQAILLLGDIQYPAGTLSDYQGGFGSSWSGLASRLKPAPGNHDYGSGHLNDYLSYFSSLGVETGGSNGYYAFTLGAWRIISLNSNCTQVACSAGSAQEQWLRAQLAEAQAAGQCTLAYWHHPRASGGLHGDQADVEGLWRAMVDEGGDLVLAGHDHHYQRFAPLDGDANLSAVGLPSFVVGTGGVNLRAASDRAGSAKIITDVFGLLRFTLADNGYSYQWVGEGGAGSDSGSGSCR